MKRILRYTVVVSLIVMFAASAILLAAERGGRYGLGDRSSAGELLAALGTVKGTLAEEKGEWEIVSGKATYLLRFGNRAYLAGTGMPLEEGKEITVEGSVSGGDIVVFNATLEGKTYVFRDKSGVPLWAQDGGVARRRPCDDGYGGGLRGGRGCCGGEGREWRDRDDDSFGWRGRGRR
jgi:hypothetical protein